MNGEDGPKIGDLSVTVTLTGDAYQLLDALKRVRNVSVVRSVRIVTYVPDGPARKPQSYYLPEITRSGMDLALSGIESFARRVPTIIADKYRDLVEDFSKALKRRG
jgi:hypothetical protein